jgi:hypothetical protein
LAAVRAAAGKLEQRRCLCGDERGELAFDLIGATGELAADLDVEGWLAAGEAARWPGSTRCW